MAEVRAGVMQTQIAIAGIVYRGKIFAILLEMDVDCVVAIRWDFEIWILFVICYLGFGIYI
jgi:hypothetical protein